MPNFCHVTRSKIKRLGSNAVIDIRNYFFWSNVVTTVVGNQIQSILNTQR